MGDSMQLQAFKPASVRQDAGYQLVSRAHCLHSVLAGIVLMKFLHTSDWHVGRAIRGQSRLSEQEAALQQVLTHAREQAVDCVLIAGDVFDTSAPPPEAEALVYRFFGELSGAGIPAVVIAGNHDHPRRFEAIAPLLSSLGIHARGLPRGPADGAVVEVTSRDGRERALIATLPWLNERDMVDFARLQEEPGAPLLQYAERVQLALAALASVFQPDRVNVIMAHLLADDAMVGPGGGERELHMAMGIYGVRREALPVAAQYIALGHVHRPQEIACATKAAYSGSLLQLDFGERHQEKSVNLVEVHPRQPARLKTLPVTAGRRLIDVGSPERGVALNELAQYRDLDDESWFRVYVDLDMPVANLPQLVRAELPSAVHVERARGHIEAQDGAESVERLGPVEMFQKFYESNLGRGKPPAEETMALFRRLLTEEEHAEA
jgi:exonuclease SbcD